MIPRPSSNLQARSLIPVLFSLALILAGCAPQPPPLPDTAGQAQPATHTPPTLTGSPPTLAPAPPLPGAATGSPADTPTPVLSRTQAAALGKPPASLASLRLLFAREGKLWIWSPQREHALTHYPEAPYQARFSSDGRLIAFRRGGNLWLIHPDGTGERALLTTVDFREMDPSGPLVDLLDFVWLPGAHTLLFNTTLKAGPGAFQADDLYRIEVDQGDWRRLLVPGSGGNIYPSPDGQWLALVTPDTIKVAAPNGRALHTRLTFPPVDTGSERQYYPQPVWAADSLSMWVDLPPSDPRSGGLAEVWQVPLEGPPPAKTAEVELYRDTWEVSISPDGSHMAYVQGTGGNQVALHLARTDGSDDRVVFTSERFLRVEGWAPDSQRFIFLAEQLMLAGLDGPVSPLLPAPSIYGGFLQWLTEEYFLLQEKDGDMAVVKLGSIQGDTWLLTRGPYEGFWFLDSVFTE